MPGDSSNPHAEGSPVDLIPWAYSYCKDSLANPPETAWLKSHKFLRMEVVNGSMTWHYDDTPSEFPQEQVLCAFLWEEPRQIKKVEIEFAHGGPVPTAEELVVACREVDSMWEDCHPWKFDPHLEKFPPADPPVTTENNYPVFHFNSPVERFTKLYVIYTGRESYIPIPIVRAYGPALWAKPESIEIEWGFQEGLSELAWNGRLEVYNGILSSVQPLEDGNGLVMHGVNHWEETLPTTKRRGLFVQVLPTTGPINSRTLLTLWTTVNDATISVRDLENGPILAPGLDLFVTKAGTGISGRNFHSKYLISTQLTIRHRVREHSEQSLTDAMQEVFGSKPLPKPPRPPFDPVMKIDLPEQLLNAQWRLGSWHLSRWAQKLEDGSYCVSIWPYNKGEDLKPGTDGREGTAAIGAESYQIIRSLDLLGQNEIAQGGLNYWIHGEHALPFVWGSEIMEGDALSNPYNSPNQRSPGYDQKHSGGHGKILETAAFHYRLTADEAWFQKAQPILEKACQAITRLRQAWQDEYPEDMWSYGLIPPANTGDGGETRLFYYVSTSWYTGMKEIVELLEQHNSPIVKDLQAELSVFRQAIRQAALRSALHSPLVQVRDGTYRRFIPWQPYLRGIDLEVGMNEWYTGPISSGLRLASEILDVEEPIVQEMIDVYEDVLLSHKVSQPPEGETWFSRCGFNGQCGHEVHQNVYLLDDDIPLYLRSVFNSYAAEIEPDQGYTFWEGPAKAGAPDKIFEEAAFLERLRNMLVLEKGKDLWLAAATPRAWLKQEKHIGVSNAPTFFGPTSYTIQSDVERRRINATINMPTRNLPAAVCLRLRHPHKTPIHSVRVNGRSWDDFDPLQEVIYLEPTTHVVRVQVNY